MADVRLRRTEARLGLEFRSGGLQDEDRSWAKGATIGRPGCIRELVVGREEEDLWESPGWSHRPHLPASFSGSVWESVNTHTYTHTHRHTHGLNHETPKSNLPTVRNMTYP